MYLRTLRSTSLVIIFASTRQEHQFDDAHAMRTSYVNHYDDVTVGISTTYTSSPEIYKKNLIKIIDLIL